MQSRELLRFHLTGETPAGVDLEPEPLWPAFLAPFRDLSTLRYDYPLVLLEGPGLTSRPVSGLIDDVLGRIASPGPAGERVRQHVLALEQRMRSRVEGEAPVSLSQSWESAAAELMAEAREEDRETLRQSLDRAWAAVEVDGLVIDCDAEAATRIVEHAWQKTSVRQANEMGSEIAELTQKLSNILRADDARSRAGLSSGRLAASVGASFRSEFDFESWSRLLTAQPAPPLDGNRRRRIEGVLSVFRSQRFFPTGKTRPYSFRFGRISRAVAAFRRRLPPMLELIKALRIARLEIENRYSEDRHDAYFDAFDSTRPLAGDLARFPSYLVTTHVTALSDADVAELTEILTGEAPVRVLVHVDELAGGPQAGDDGRTGSLARLASLALGLGEAFVMQATASTLPSLETALMAGLSYPGPSLLSVFGAPPDTRPEVSPYLAAAAAVQARAFPVFIYDPAAGEDWADRLRVDLNPQPENDWPIEMLDFEDDRLQRVTEASPFTYIDFALCDSRNASQFLRVPRNFWTDEMEPAWRFLNGEPPPGKVPYVVVASEDDTLERLLVRNELIEVARRCRKRWHSLQELGGIHNSHARRLLDAERAQWEIEKAEEMRARPVAATAVVDAEPAVSTAETLEADVEASATRVEEVSEVVDLRSHDEPYIETARCTTCDECTAINPRMFAYDENKQAYLADLTAGTYRQLVEAAEACQVAIIHPGRPQNPNEPGLEELIARAALFN